MQILVSALFLVSAVTHAQTEAAEDKAVDTAQEKLISMVVGDSKVIKTDFVIKRIGVGSADVMEASRVSDNEILLNATGVGETNLLVWSDKDVQIEYKLAVFERSFAERTKQEIEQLLVGIDGLTLKAAGTSVVLEGEVYSEEELKKINIIAKRFDNVVNLVTAGEVYRKLLAQEMQKTIGIDGIKVRYTKRGYIVEGVVLSDFEVKYAIGIAKSFSKNVIDALYVNPQHQTQKATSDVVQLDLKIIEVSKDLLSDFSSDVNIGASSEIGVSNLDPTSAVATLSLSDDNLRSLKENGDGRVLVEQSVIVESTKSANIFVGDELPIPVAQSGSDSFSIEFKEVGIKMEITPSTFLDSTVNMIINAESSLVTGESLGGAPQISVVRVSTSAKVKDKQNLVFAGLIQHRETSSYFGSGGSLSGEKQPNRLLDDRREIVLMVRPTVLSTTNNALRQMRRSVERSYKDYEIEKIQRSNSSDK